MLPYTYAQFVEHYGPVRGASFWWEAEIGPALLPRQGPQAPSAPAQQAQPSEARRAAKDGKHYMRAQFVKHYGSWGAAAAWARAP
eukprot:12091085-Alexandrium_andersonii.AAC.1